MLANLYLTFNGNCREAMTFYKECLGGELIFQTVGETPLSEKMPQRMKNTIIHATLTHGPLVLMGSDMVGKNGLIRSNAVSISLQCESEEQVRKCYQMLSQEGHADHPLENSFWGALFGDLTDKYGIHWLLHFENRNQQDQRSTVNMMEK